jgi:hypothetical protein
MMLLPTMWALLAKMSAYFSHPGGAAVGAATREGIVDLDHYAVLDISPSADALEIRAAYRRAALSTHPDKGGTEKAFHAIADAFNILSCPTTRYLYDQERTKKFSQAHGKRTCRGDPKGIDVAKSCKFARKDHAFQRLRTLLQDMDRPLREKTLSRIPLRVQQALMEFIKNNPEKPVEPLVNTERNHQRLASGSTRLQAKANGASEKTSNAQLDIEHLRFYTRWTSMEVAVEQQLILARVRDRLGEASGNDATFWDTPRNIYQVFESVLAEHQMSMKEFDVSVYVEIRAPQWVANCHRITSPVLPLEDAVALRTRLLSARSTSWEHLRIEWIALLQGGRHARSLEEAEFHVYQARCCFLEQQFSHAVQSIERALDCQERAEKKAKHRMEKVEQNRTQKELLKSSRTTRGRTNLLASNTGEMECHMPPNFPYLSAQRLRAHNKACSTKVASDIGVDQVFSSQNS